MALFQFYMPWRDEIAIIDSFASYEDKFVFPNIEDNILEHAPYFGIWMMTWNIFQFTSYGHLMQVMNTKMIVIMLVIINIPHLILIYLIWTVDPKMVTYQVAHLRQFF